MPLCTPRLRQIRDYVFDAIETHQTANDYIFNDFALATSYLPYTALVDLPEEGKVWVLALDGDDAPNMSRTRMTQRDIPVMIALQKAVDPNDTDTIDDLVDLFEELRYTTRIDVPAIATDFTWIRNEVLKDETDLPYSYLGMREKSTFEAYFTAYYRVILIDEGT